MGTSVERRALSLKINSNISQRSQATRDEAESNQLYVSGHSASAYHPLHLEYRCVFFHFHFFLRGPLLRPQKDDAQPATKLSYLGEPRENARARGRGAFPLPLAALPLDRAFSRDLLRSPKQESLLAGQMMHNQTLHSIPTDQEPFSLRLRSSLHGNRSFALRHHFTTTTRILQGFAFLCKLRLLLFKPHWDYKIYI